MFKGIDIKISNNKIEINNFLLGGGDNIVLSKTDFKIGDTADVTFYFEEGLYYPTDLDSIVVMGGDINDLNTSDSKTFSGVFTPNNIFEQDSNTISLNFSKNDSTIINLVSEVYSIDTKAPFVNKFEFSDDNLNIGDTATLTIKFSEAISGFSINDISAFDESIGLNGTLYNLTTNDSITFTALFTPDENKESLNNMLVLNNKYTDIAGNPIANTTLSYDIDTKRPEISIFTIAQETLLIGDNGNITISFSEKINSLDVTNFTVNNGTIDNFQTSNNIGWTFVFTPNNDVLEDSNILTIKSYTDLAGNSNLNTSSIYFKIDTKQINVNKFKLDRDSLILNDSATLNLEFSKKINMDTFDLSNIVLNGHGTLVDLETTDSKTFTAKFKPTGGEDETDGELTLLNTYKDVTGNDGVTATHNFKYDTKRPTVESFDFRDSEGNDIDKLDTGTGSDYKNVASGTVTVKFSEKIRDSIPESIIDDSNGDGTISNWSHTPGSDSLTFTFTGTTTVNVDGDDTSDRYLRFDSIALINNLPTDMFGNEILLNDTKTSNNSTSNYIVGLCLTKDTLIKKGDGTYDKIENIKQGDIIDTGFGYTTSVKQLIISTPRDKIICIKKNTLGANTPSKDLFIIDDHPIYIKEDDVYVYPKDLLDSEGIYYMDNQDDYLYNIKCSDGNSFVANDLIVGDCWSDKTKPEVSNETGLIQKIINYFW